MDGVDRCRWKALLGAINRDACNLLNVRRSRCTGLSQCRVLGGGSIAMG